MCLNIKKIRNKAENNENPNRRFSLKLGPVNKKSFCYTIVKTIRRTARRVSQFVSKNKKTFNQENATKSKSRLEDSTLSISNKSASKVK